MDDKYESFTENKYQEKRRRLVYFNSYVYFQAKNFSFSNMQNYALNTLEQNLSPPRASHSALGCHRPRFRALSPSGN